MSEDYSTAPELMPATSRQVPVVIAASVLATAALICVTVLIAVGKIEQGAFKETLTVLVIPAVMILLGVQQTQTKQEIRSLAGGVQSVKKLVNGGLEERIAAVVVRTLQSYRLVPVGDLPAPTGPPVIQTTSPVPVQRPAYQPDPFAAGPRITPQSRHARRAAEWPTGRRPIPGQADHGFTD